jgi:hypothetical protein
MATVSMKLEMHNVYNVLKTYDNMVRKTRLAAGKSVEETAKQISADARMFLTQKTGDWGTGTLLRSIKAQKGRRSDPFTTGLSRSTKNKIIWNVRVGDKLSPYARMVEEGTGKIVAKNKKLLIHKRAGYGHASERIIASAKSVKGQAGKHFFRDAIGKNKDTLRNITWSRLRDSLGRFTDLK